jgi:hypothetical protein
MMRHFIDNLTPGGVILLVIGGYLLFMVIRETYFHFFPRRCHECNRLLQCREYPSYSGGDIQWWCEEHGRRR